MNVTNSDGTVTRLEGQAAIDKGEGIRVMIERLQGRRSV